MQSLTLPARNGSWNAISLTAGLAAAVLAVPVLVVLGSIFTPSGDV